MSTVKKRMGLPGIFNLNMGFLGIQFGWGLQMANMSAIYEFLGAEPDQIPILWLAAPLTGLLVQPIIGHMSDRTWTRLGRRRPYFLVGAICATAALIMMPYSSALWMAASLLWLMDLSVNVSMEPFRAFVADLLPEEQQTTGFSIQAVLIGIGAVVASALPWILQNIAGMDPKAGASIPDIIKYSFHIGAAAYFLAVLWTIVTTKEYPPADLEAHKRHVSENKGVGHFFSELWDALKNMPPTMRQLAWVQVFSWMGLFCFFLYFTIAVSHNIFGAESMKDPTYMEGVEWAGLCRAAYNLVTFFFSFSLPWVCMKLTRKGAHVFCLLAGAACFILMHFVHDKYMLMVLMIGVGINWAGILALPYAMLAGGVPQEKMGVYMGIFNFFITIPQIIISLGFGYVMHYLLHDNRELGVVAGGVFMIIAAGLVLRVQDKGEERTA